MVQKRIIEFDNVKIDLNKLLILKIKMNLKLIILKKLF